MNFNPKHCLMFISIFMVMNNLITGVTIRKCTSELELDTCYLYYNTIENGKSITTEYYGTCDSGEKC